MAWSRDGRRLASTSWLVGTASWGLFVESLDDPGRFDMLVEMPVDEIWVAGWTSDGAAIIARGADVGSGTPIFRLVGGQPLETIAKEPGTILGMDISPDGRWLAYDISRTGPFQILVMPIDGKGARVPVNAKSGQRPRWSRVGRQLFFWRDGALAVDVVATASDIHFGAERRLFEWDAGNEYDVSPPASSTACKPFPARRSRRRSS
jgi:hypothetical protein